MAEPEQTPTQALLDGRYRLGECIGEGGMARVHRGEDLILERTVAVKMIRASDGGASSVARTRGEVAVLASLSHPSLVTLLDARVVPGEPEYLVMEFIDGPTLRDRLDSGPLAPRDVALLGTELAEALHVVHSAGVVHRDVKPSNVLLAATELPERPFRTKLADFGIAHLLDSSRLTSPGIVVGTPAYLAPEQARGAPPAPAADIFALGVVLLEALTGAPPFGEATGVEAMVARQTLAPPIPDWVGPEWTELLRAMTALDPGARPSAMEVASACYRLLSHAPITPSAAPAPAAPAIPPAPPVPDAAADAPPGVAPSGRQHVGSPTVEAPPIPIPTVPLPLSASLHASGPVSTISAGSPARHVRGRSARGRRLVFAGGTAAAMTAVVAGTIWVMGLGGAAPEPAMTIPAVQPTTEPTETEQDAGTEPDTGTEVETVAEDPKVPASEPDSPAGPAAPKPAAPEAPKGPGAPGERPGGGPDKAEREREKAEREREKAEQAAERAEEKQRKAEERAQEKEEREQGQKGNG